MTGVGTALSRPETPLERAAMAAATSLGFYLFARFVNHRWYLAALERNFKEDKVIAPSL
jgi:hypothetical protein